MTVSARAGRIDFPKPPVWRGGSAGFTLAEIMVAVIIIGIITAMFLPQYVKTVENSRANDAVSVLQMVGTSNRILGVDSGGFYADAKVPGGTAVAISEGTCNGAACGTNPAQPPSTNARAQCDLIACGYLAKQTWSTKSYNFMAMNGAASQTDYCGLSAPAGLYVACCKRNGGSTPYSTWGYTIDVNGNVTAYGNAPPAPS